MTGGLVDHPNIKSTKSIVDFIFRALAYEYLGRTDLVHVLDKPEVLNTGTDDWDEIPTTLEYEKKTPPLSDVRIVAPAAAKTIEPQPAKTPARQGSASPKMESTSISAVNAAAKQTLASQRIACGDH